MGFGNFVAICFGQDGDNRQEMIYIVASVAPKPQWLRMNCILIEDDIYRESNRQTRLQAWLNRYSLV